jgi:hypothetical protein
MTQDQLTVTPAKAGVQGIRSVGDPGFPLPPE